MASVVPLIMEIIDRGGSAELTVAGNSMRPLLTHRISRVRLAAPTAYTTGDVVLYRRDNGAFVLHRIIRQKDGAFVMRGDNQYVSEPGIRPEQVLAVMTAFTRDGVRWHENHGFLYRMYRIFWVYSCPIRRRMHAAFGRIGSRLQKNIRQK